LAFSVGMFIYHDYHRRRLFERSELEVIQYYTLYYIAFMSLPRLGRSIGFSLVPSMEIFDHLSFPSPSLSPILFVSSIPLVLRILLCVVLSLGFGWCVWGWSLDTHSPRVHNLPPPAMSRSAYIRASLFPPPFPNGWYKLYGSSDVTIGKVLTVEALNQHFAVYRRPDNSVRITDFQEGLTTVGDYEKHGSKRWHAFEYASTVLVYYSLKPVGDAPPYYPMPLPEIDSGHFRFGGFLSSDNLTMHLQDIAENAGDTAHFGWVHGRLSLPILRQFFTIEHDVVFEQSKKDPKTGKNPIGVFKELPALFNKRFGIRVPPNVPSSVTLSGPAILTVRFNTPFGDIIVHKTFVPRGVMLFRMDDAWYADPKVPPLLTRYVIHEALNAFNDDIVIWTTKGYFPKPLLARGDGPINVVRRWFRHNFYDECSYKLPPLTDDVWSATVVPPRDGQSLNVQELEEKETKEDDELKSELKGFN